MKKEFYDTAATNTKKEEKKMINLTIRHLMAVCIPETTIAEKQPAMVTAILKNIQDLGFTFSAGLFQALLGQSAEFLKRFYNDLVETLKELVGADKEYEPFYPNFPVQVAEADDAELVMNAIIHYMSFGTLYPDYPKEERFPLIGEYPLKEIRLCTREDVMKVFTNLLASPVSISEQDKKDIVWFVDNTDYAKYFPENIPMKEVKAFFGNLMVQRGDVESAKALFKTATDVLRLIAAMSDQDISLAGRMRVRKMKRVERRFIMNLLAECGSSLLEDMFRYRELWVIVGEIVHPGEFRKDKRYRKVVAAFDVIRKDDKPLFFGGQVETAIAMSDWRKALNLLATRPGELARRLDQLLRIEGASADAILEVFSGVAGDVATRALWQAKAHFDHRKEAGARAFFPKGEASKCMVIEDTLAMLPDDVCKKASEACYEGILKQYAKREPMGSVYVDPAFKGYAAPFALRGASHGFRPVAMGSRLPFSDDCKIIRPFIWWTNTENRGYVDIDLSVTFSDENWKPVGEVSYCNVRNESLRAYHSGDITDGGKFGGKGVSEFLDFDPAYILEKGARYAIIQVYAYSPLPFCETPCHFGWMERQDAESGEIYDPKTVENRISITANSREVIPAIIDCKTREIIWADITVRSHSHLGGNNVYSNLVGTTASAWAIANWEKPSLYDVILANARARGTVAENRDAADVIFSNDLAKPIVKVVVKDENGRESVQEAEKAVQVKDAFDLAYYMGEML